MGGHLREPWAATQEGRSRGSLVDTADFQVTPRPPSGLSRRVWPGCTPTLLPSVFVSLSLQYPQLPPSVQSCC